MLKRTAWRRRIAELHTAQVGVLAALFLAACWFSYSKQELAGRRAAAYEYEAEVNEERIARESDEIKKLTPEVAALEAASVRADSEWIRSIRSPVSRYLPERMLNAQRAADEVRERWTEHPASRRLKELKSPHETLDSSPGWLRSIAKQLRGEARWWQVATMTNAFLILAGIWMWAAARRPDAGAAPVDQARSA